MKCILHKWQYLCRIQRPYELGYQLGWQKVSVGVFKLTSQPPEGQIITKDNYKGFIIQFYIWFPIDT